VHDLVPGVPLELEPVLEHGEQFSVLDRHVELLAELPVQCVDGELAELDSTPDRPVEAELSDPVEPD